MPLRIRGNAGAKKTRRAGLPAAGPQTMNDRAAK